MGWLRRRAAERQAQAWQQRDETLREMLEVAREFQGYTAADFPGTLPLQLKTGERPFFVVHGAALIEPRRGAGHWEGRSSGLSVRVPGTKSVRYRVGATKGTYASGEERPTAIDTGTTTITNQRAVFQGTKQVREWPWSKLIGLQHDAEQPWTSLPVSNRQKVSGFLYDDENAERIRFVLDLVVARFSGTDKELVAQIQEELSEHTRDRPPEGAVQSPISAATRPPSLPA